MDISRREIIKAAGLGLVTTGLGLGHVQSVNADPAPSDFGKGLQESLPKQLADTEVEQATAALPLPPSQRVGYAIVGLGRLTFEQILPGFAQSRRSRITALVTGDRAKGLHVASELGLKPGSVYDYRTFDRLQNDPSVDAVYIVLPNGLHHEFTVRAARSGKHVLCEKPMANTVAEAEDMIRACKDAHRKLMIAYRMQYEPYNTLATELTRSRAFGAAKFLEAINTQCMDNPKQWRLHRALSGGGALPDVGIYCLNAARYLTGEEPVEVAASIYSTPGDPRFREVEETVQFQLRFPSGFQASCVTSYGAHQSRRYRVHAENGWIDLDPAFAYQGLRMRTAQKGDDGHEYITERHVDEKNQFTRELDHFSQCIAMDLQPHTPGEEGLQDMKVMHGIYAAAESGRPVRFPEYRGLDVTRGPKPTEQG